VGSRPAFDIADLVRNHRPALEASHRLSPVQRRVLTAISRCRTAALGGHLEVCEQGDYQRNAYNSCRNRHCPKCQALAQEKWIEARSERLLDIGHFHAVFTLPAELRALALRHPAEVYQALMQASSETLLALGRTRLKATLGITLVLHTWTRELDFHPHVHALVTAGGLALDGTGFVVTRNAFLFPVLMMGVVFRAKMLHALGALMDRGAFPEVGTETYAALASRVARKPWIVYAKKPFKRSHHVLAYLGRYTHRVGIANSRLMEATGDRVTFRTKQGRTATLHPVEFLRRLTQHVLPPGFHKTRHTGLYGSARPGGHLERARIALGRPRRRRKEGLLQTLEGAIRSCPICGGTLRRSPLTSISPRAPPPPTP
jgi:hypothetical protein